MTRNNKPTEHFIERVSQRMPRDVSPNRLWVWLRKMRREDNPELRFVMATKLKRSVYKFKKNGKVYWVVISHISNKPITVLSEGMWIKNRNGKVKYVGGKRCGPPTRRTR